MTSSNGQRPSPPGHNSGNGKAGDIDLAQQVADLVYKMWKRDLRIERERFRTKANTFSRRGGI